MEPRRFTVDASVFVSALRDSDPAHEQSAAFLANSGSESLLIVPNLVQPEVGGAISRATGDADLACDALRLLSGTPHLTVVALDDELAETASKLAVKARLRGADAADAATALRFETILITLDMEQRLRLPQDIIGLHPREAIGT